MKKFKYWESYLVTRDNNGKSLKQTLEEILEIGDLIQVIPTEYTGSGGSTMLLEALIIYDEKESDGK